MTPKHCYRFGPFELDPAERVLLRDARPVPLRPKDLETLLVLVEHSGHIVEKEDLLKKVWPGTFVEEGNLPRHVSTLRHLLGEAPDGKVYIETIPKRGYRFVAPVERIIPTATEPREEPAATAAPSAAAQARARLRMHIPISRVGALAVLAVLLIVAYVAGLRPWPRPQPRPKRIMLAVLPFENLSGDPAQEYVSDGLTEEMISQLGRLNHEQLGVIARTSAMTYKGNKKPIAQIARELGVSYVLEGSLRRSGDRLRITAQLVRVSDQTHLWASDYDQTMSDIVTLQGQVAQAISREIQVLVTPQEQTRLAAARPVNPEAYQAYLKGRFYLNKRSEEGLQKAVEYFNEAGRLNPRYAQAFAGLADAYNLGVFYGFPLEGEGIARAKAASQKALAIDDSLAEAHAALGYTKFMWEWDWPGAEQEFKRALQLNPGYAPAHHWHAMYLAAIGRLNESIEEMKRARQMDPLSLIVNTAMGYMYYFARQHDQAIEQCRAALALDSNFMVAYAVMGWAYDEKGMREEAIAALHKAVELSGGNPLYLATLGRAYARSGNKAAAQEVLGELDALSRRKLVPPSDRAMILVALGNRAAALELLEKGQKEGDASLVWLKVDPQFDSLRSDARFQALLRRMKFPQ